jgi:hypothetical protein
MPSVEPAGKGAGRRGWKADLAIGVVLGVVLGIAIVAAFVFWGSEGSVDAPRVTGISVANVIGR